MATKKSAATDKAPAPKRAAQKRGDQAPEAKRAPKDQAEAADKLFRDADRNAASGLPVDLTVGQHENIVRRAALGY